MFCISPRRTRLLVGVEVSCSLESMAGVPDVFLPSEGDQPSDQVDECVDGASVSGVLNLAEVFVGH